jgi:sugar/nucleoside kinase (ribokinase family)
VARVLVVGDLIDDVLVVPDGPIRPDTDTRAEIYSRPGGSAANFACWLAHAAKQTGGPIEVDFVGRVGALDVARHEANLKAAGVNPRLQADASTETGAIVVLVQNQQRSFLTSRGANRNLDASLIDDELMRGASFLYLSGYSLFDSLSIEAVKSLIARAKAQGLKVVCDPGSAGFIEDFGVLRFLETLKGVDILLPSLEEARVLSGENQPSLAAEWLSQRFDTVVVTTGAEGAQLCVAGSKPQPIAVVAADVVDATGAGDAFAAGFIAGLVSGQSAEQAAKFAAKLGAIAVTLPGGRPKQPS